VRAVSAVLLHHPILDRERAVVTGAITNLDLHDISRSAYTFGLERFFVAHPIAAQRALAQRVKEHWTSGSGARRIPDRSPPMQSLEIVESLDGALAACGAGAELWVTSAQDPGASCLDFALARELLRGGGAPVLIAFGTGWGLAGEVMSRASQRLSPVRSPRSDGYNHLSVRAAAAIIFDRLLGTR
jgi:hypothetical protein